MGEKSRDLVKTTTRGSLILMLGRISSTIVLALGMLLVANLLGEGNFASYSIAASIVSIGSTFSSLGIYTSTVRFVSRYRYNDENHKLRTIIESSFLLSIVSSLFITLIIYSLSGYLSESIFHQPEQKSYIELLSFSIIGQSLLRFSWAVTIGYERMALRSYTDILYSSLKSVSSPLLIFLGFGTYGAIIGSAVPVLAGGLLGLIFVYFIHKNEVKSSGVLTHRDAALQMLRYSFPQYLTSLIGGTIPKILESLLYVSVISELYGNYSVTLNFAVLLSFITMPIGTSIFPLFSKLESDDKQLGVLYKSSVRYSTLFAFPIAVIIMALADPIRGILFPNQYFYAGEYLRLYMLISLPIGLGSTANGALLNSQNEARIIFQSTLVKYAVSLPVAFYIIPRFGVVGMFLVLFLNNLVSTLYTNLKIKQIFGYSIDLSFLYKNLIICGVIYSSVYTLFANVSWGPWMEFILGGVLSLTLYLLGLVFTKALTMADYSFLRRLVASFGKIGVPFVYVIDLMVKYA